MSSPESSTPARSRSGDVSMEELEAAVFGDFVPVEAIEACEKDYKQRVSENTATDELKFTYAWHLVKSQYKNDIRKGVRLMDGLVRKGKDQRDYYYFMALGHYKLEEYEVAESCVDRVLQMEPNNYQAKQLKECIIKKLKRDGLLGMGVLGGAAVVGGAIAVGAATLLGMGIAKLAKSSKR